MDENLERSRNMLERGEMKVSHSKTKRVQIMRLKQAEVEKLKELKYLRLQSSSREKRDVNHKPEIDENGQD